MYLSASTTDITTVNVVISTHSRSITNNAADTTGAVIIYTNLICIRVHTVNTVVLQNC